MGIQTQSQTYVECDICGSYWANTVTQAAAKEELRAEGWTFGKKVKCPECSVKSRSHV